MHDTYYNSNSRFLHQKFKIYFTSNDPLEVTKDNYLMSSSDMLEASKASDNPFGEVTSNEIDITLLNQNSIFNPENVEGPYYGLIKKGVKIEVFMRPDEVQEWDPQGVYYVTDWSTSANGLAANITANDSLYAVLNAPVPHMSVVRGSSVREFLAYYFDLFGIDAVIDPTLTDILPFGYAADFNSNKDLLTDIMTSSLADCFCDNIGRIVVLSKVKARSVRAILTDNDQIISASIKQTISTNYDGASVICNACQESEEKSLLSVTALEVPAGISDTDLMTFTAKPVLCVRSIKTTGTQRIKPVSFVATADNIVCRLQSVSTNITKLDIVGTVLERVKTTLSTSDNKPLSVDKKFIQTQEAATKVLNYADAFITSDMPTLELSIRGNPTLEIGDLIVIQSTMYKLNYSGILVRIKNKYEGSYSSTITLVDSSLLEEE